MSYGYSQNLVEANRQADAESLGVALGRTCIDCGISVRQTALELGVSRMTIYNWFWGINTPAPPHHDRIKQFIECHKKRK